MTLNELIEAMDVGKKVYWKNLGYICFRDNLGQYLLTYTPNGYTIGIFHRDNVGMNIDPSDCFMC